MPILTPTKEDGAQTKPNEMLYVEPSQLVTDDMLEQQLPDIGLNAPFVADLLSAMLTHERCGRHLYRAVSNRTNNPVLKRKYNEFGAETERHVEILEALVMQTGGNPAYVSPNARAVEGMDTKLVESTYATSGSLDLMTQEMALLDAVFVAESIDHANWQLLSALVERMREGELRDAFRAAVEEVEAQEDEHLGWATQTKQRLVMMMAESGMMAMVGMEVEEIVVRIRGWFDRD